MEKTHFPVKYWGASSAHHFVGSRFYALSWHCRRNHVHKLNLLVQLTSLKIGVILWIYLEIFNAWNIDKKLAFSNYLDGPRSTKHVFKKVGKTICCFHGSSFKGFSIVFAVFWLAKVESSQKLLERGFSDIFSGHICRAATETIRVTNYAKMFRKPSLKLLRWFLLRGANNLFPVWRRITRQMESNCQKIFSIVICKRKSDRQ